MKKNMREKNKKNKIVLEKEGINWEEYKIGRRDKKYLSSKDLELIDNIWLELKKIKEGKKISIEFKKKLIEGLYNPLISKELWGRSAKVTINEIKQEFLRYKKREDLKRRGYNIKGLRKKQSLGNKRKDEIFKRNREGFIYYFKKWKINNLTILEDCLYKLGEISVNDWESWNKELEKTYLEIYWLKDDKLIREYKHVAKYIWKEHYKWSLLNFKKKKIINKKKKEE